MSSTRRTCMQTGAWVLVILGAFACGEPTAPFSQTGMAPSFTVKDGKHDLPLLTRAHPVGPEHASAVIGPAGGTLSLSGAGLTLVIPPGALTRPLAIQVRTNSRDLVSYAFAPHGLQFAKPIEIVQSLSGLRPMDGSSVTGGYLENGRLDVDTAGVGHFAQLLPVHRGNGSLAFLTGHFSGYAFASGVAARDLSGNEQ
jgi:ZU5 domain-containing protein